MPKSLFSSKHHRFLSEVINGSRYHTTPKETTSIRWLVNLFCFALKWDNPKFDTEAFRIACGEQPVHSD